MSKVIDFNKVKIKNAAVAIASASSQLAATMNWLLASKQCDTDELAMAMAIMLKKAIEESEKKDKVKQFVKQKLKEV